MKIQMSKLFFIAAFTVIGFSQACKKSDYVIDSDKDLAYVALSKGGFSETVMFEKITLQNLELNVAVTTRSGLKKELHATVDVDPAVLAEYNQKFGKDFQILPSAAYSVTSTAVTIPTGTNTIQVPIQVNTSLVDDTKDFVLPVKIKSAGDLPISKNFEWVLLKINKFKYEGVWRTKGKRTNYNADESLNSENELKSPDHDKTLTKISADTYDVNRVANLAPTPANVFRIKINPDNTLIISGYIGDPTQPISNNEAIESVFNPRTKEFTVNYKYVLTSGAKRIMNETWTKK